MPIQTIPRFSLDPNIFQFFESGQDPIFKDSIKAQITVNIQEIQPIARMNTFYATGEALTPYYNQKSPIDVLIEVNPHDIDNIGTADLLFALDRINKKLAVGTTHPIMYHLIPGKINTTKFDVLYDIYNERWIKKPDDVSPILQEYLVQINSMLQSIDLRSGKILHNTLTIDQLKMLDPTNLQVLKYLIQQEITQHNVTIDYMRKLHGHIKSMHFAALDNILNAQEISRYGLYHKLPDQYIIKLLKRYYLIKLTQRISSLLDKEFNVQGLVRNSRMGKIFQKVK